MPSTPARRQTGELFSYDIRCLLTFPSLADVHKPATPYRRRAQRHHPYFPPGIQFHAPRHILSTPQSPLLRCSLCNHRPRGLSTRLDSSHALCARHIRQLCDLNVGPLSTGSPIPALDLGSLRQARCPASPCNMNPGPMQGASPPTPASNVSYDTTTSNEPVVTDLSAIAHADSPHCPSPPRSLTAHSKQIPANFYKSNYIRYPTEDKDLQQDYDSFYSFPSIPRCPSTMPEEDDDHFGTL